MPSISESTLGRFRPYLFISPSASDSNARPLAARVAKHQIATEPDRAAGLTLPGSELTPPTRPDHGLRSPAVSENSTGQPSSAVTPVTTSRVVPACCEQLLVRYPNRALTRLSLPTLARHQHHFAGGQNANRRHHFSCRLQRRIAAGSLRSSSSTISSMARRNAPWYWSSSTAAVRSVGASANADRAAADSGSNSVPQANGARVRCRQPAARAID